MNIIFIAICTAGILVLLGLAGIGAYVVRLTAFSDINKLSDLRKLFNNKEVQDGTD